MTDYPIYGPPAGGCDCEHAEHHAETRIDSRSHLYNAVDATEWLNLAEGTFKVCGECVRLGHMVVAS